MSAIAIDELSPAERLDLIGDLWDSLEDADIPLSHAQKDELDRRLEAADGEPPRGKTWQKLEATLKQRLR